MSKKLGIDVKELLEIFSEFDSDGSGSIDTSELQAFLGAMGLFTGAEEVEQVASTLDANGDGTIDIKEFLDFMLDQEDFQNLCPSMGGAEMVKYHVLAKLYARRLAKCATNVQQSGTGEQ